MATEADQPNGGPLAITLTAGAPLHEIAAALDALAEADGRGELRRAARSLRQWWTGPTPIRDEAAIEEAWELFVAGAAKTLWAAQLAASGNNRSAAERLRRKMLRRRAESISTRRLSGCADSPG